MSEWKFRTAEASDAPAFSAWLEKNPQIDLGDVVSASGEKNPTVVFFVIEDENGKVIMFAPFYLQMTLGYIGFNPESNGQERKTALQMMLDGSMAFAVQCGVRELTTLTKEGYPVAEWAKKHGFDVESRQLFKYDINKILEIAEK